MKMANKKDHKASKFPSFEQIHKSGNVIRIKSHADQTKGNYLTVFENSKRVHVCVWRRGEGCGGKGGIRR